MAGPGVMTGSRVESGVQVSSRYFDRLPTLKLWRATSVSRNDGAMKSAMAEAFGAAPRTVRISAAVTRRDPVAGGVTAGFMAAMMAAAVGTVKVELSVKLPAVA